MKPKKLKFAALILVFLGLIGWAFASPFWKYNDWSDGNYYVIDIMGNGTNDLVYKLSYGTSIGRINEVKRIGSNNQYIIAEDARGKYWLIDKKEDNKHLNGSEICQGPFTEKEFQQRLIVLNLEELEFEKQFD